LTVYAAWRKEYDALILHFNGGFTSESYPDRHTPGTPTKLPVNVAKNGAIFAGWYMNEDFSGDPVTEIPASHEGEAHVYARWSLSVIELGFNGSAVTDKSSGSASFSGTFHSESAPTQQIEWINPSEDNGNNGYISLYNDGANGTMNQWLSMTNINLSGNNTVTLEFNIRGEMINDSIASAAFFFRIYDTNKTLLHLVEVASDGKVSMQGQSLGMLGTEWSRVKVTVSIAPDGTATLVGSMDDGDEKTATAKTVYTSVGDFTKAQFYCTKLVIGDVAPKAYLDDIKLYSNG
jgi:hypothetical protein